MIFPFTDLFDIRSLLMPNIPQRGYYAYYAGHRPNQRRRRKMERRTGICKTKKTKK